MADEDILERIKEMIDEEHRLRAEGGDTGRIRRLEEQLDVCWDLLRQRRAAREFGEDPGKAAPRPVEEVESYQQ